LAGRADTAAVLRVSLNGAILPKLAAKPALKRRSKIPKSIWVRRITILVAASIVAFYGIVLFALLLLRWNNPVTTAVQLERRISAWSAGRPYVKKYRFVGLPAISPNLVHAVISAEDARFYQHGGFDWKEVDTAIHEDIEKGRRRGASTIDQQLVRNLFLSTGRNVIRKAIEFSIVPLAEWVLPKRRILELYLNVVEWGPGVYGAEAAAGTYFHEPAARISRPQALELAAILPAPLRRRPGHTHWYVELIDERMREAGW
jgi:monofunctional glycosyltransferase